MSRYTHTFNYHGRILALLIDAPILVKYSPLNPSVLISGLPVTHIQCTSIKTSFLANTKLWCISVNVEPYLVSLFRNSCLWPLIIDMNTTSNIYCFAFLYWSQRSVMSPPLSGRERDLISAKHRVCRHVKQGHPMAWVEICLKFSIHRLQSSISKLCYQMILF